ncbi:uncharacterized protein G2W53_041120 [Senna tora]|uniref:Uncharacterized protein n=1 Tax=Senna tora TaxID=362788 RepID=A0A834W2M0_9FABA|nr:uncharacterized protein G2W53_041120 [Senna tora]
MGQICPARKGKHPGVATSGPLIPGIEDDAAVGVMKTSCQGSRPLSPI